MQEIIGQIRMFFWMTLHYRWAALLVAAAVCLGGWVVVHFMPPKYEVISRVYMDTDSVLKPLLSGLAVNNTMRERSAEVMKSTLVSRPNLERVILETDMDLEVRNDLQYEALVQRLMRDITVKGGKATNNIYTLTYVDRTPELAKNVVDSLLNIFLENILGASRKDTSTAGDFLDVQIQEYEKRLEDIERKLSDFKASNPEFTGLTRGSYYQRLETARSQVAQAELEEKQAVSRYHTLDQQLRDMSRALSNREPVTESAQAALVQSPLAQRIEELRNGIDQLLLAYTDEHPDVIANQKLLERLLEQQRAEAQTRAADGDSLEPQWAGNPLYQQLTAVRDGAKAELAALRVRKEELAKKVVELEQAVGTIPKLEAEYTSLTRTYDIIRNTYNGLVQRRESAALSAQVEEKADSVQFRIIDPPIVPVTPTGPNKPLFNTLVLLVGLGAGVGGAIILAQLRPAFYSRNQLAEVTGLPVLGTVSMVWGEEQVRAKRKGIAGYLVTLAGLLIGYLVFLVTDFS